MSETKKEEKGLKPFNEMLDVDLSKYIQKKPTFFKDKKTGKLVKTSPDKWLDYIEWAMVLIQLYKHGASQVLFWSKISEEKPNTLDIFIQIDGNEYVTQYPLINGNAVLSQANQLDIHKSELRGFVKCVAIHTGLGLKLWLNEEKSLDEAPETKNKSPEEKPKPTITNERLTIGINKVKNNEDKLTLDGFKKFLDKHELTKEQKVTIQEFEKTQK